MGIPGDGMSVANMQLLRRAVERESPAIVTAGDGPARRQVMIQFESSSHNNPAGMWAHYHEQDAGLLQRLIDAGQPVGVWFQSEASMLQFSSLLLKKRHSLVQHQVLIDWPQEISIVEERHQPRWMIPVSFAISGRVQVLAPNREVELETSTQVWDIGMEGASLICPTDQRLVRMAKDAWLKVSLTIRGKEFGYAAL